MIKELEKIIAIEGITSKNGLEARKAALTHWIGKYVTTLEVENSVLKKHLNPSEADFLKGFMATQIAEKLLENHALVVSEGNKIKVKVLILNKDFPKNKE